MKKPINYQLVGYPYAGKSTLVKKLVKELGFAHISLDDLKWDRGYTDVGDNDVPDAVWDEIFEEAEDQLVKYLKGGKNVANEYAWITRYWRDRIRKVAKDAGFETRLIYLKTDPKIIRQRWLENKNNRTRFHWPEEEFEGFIKNFEEPGDDEPVILYDPNIPLKDLFKV